MQPQYNHITNKAYQGGNQVALMEAKEEFKFVSDSWLTFLQAKSIGRKIKKGSKGIAIRRISEVEVKDKKGEVSTELKPMGGARVFNYDQTEEFKNKLNNEQHENI